MTVAILLSLVIAAALFARARWRQTARILFILTGVLVVAVGCGPLPEACSVIVSGGDPRRSGVSQAKAYAGVLVKIGVDPADLVIEGRSLNTWQNAQFCAAWLSEQPQDQVVLVTSGLQLRRGSLYFAHFGVHALPARADYVGAVVGVLPQACNFLLMDLTLHEYAGLMRYRVDEMLGWNIEARRPGAV